MIVVSDTSPLNYLVLIQQEHVLPSLFSRVVAPPAVVRELGHPAAPSAARLWAASPPSWLEILVPSFVDESLSLGLGETEAISLAPSFRQIDCSSTSGRRFWSLGNSVSPLQAHWAS